MEWAKHQLRRVAEVIRGVTFDSSEASRAPLPHHIRILRAGNIARTLETDNDLVWVPEARVSKKQRLRSGDIAIAMSSGSASVVGKTAQLTYDWEGSVGAFCAVVRPTKAIQEKYLAYWLLGSQFTAWRQSQCMGLNIKNLRKAELERLDVPLPPPSEQRRIVEILDQADALRKKRAEADKIADRILPALFYKMFGDPATNPKGWDVVELGALGELDRGRSRHRPRNDPRLLGGPYPFIQTGDVACAHGHIRTHTATYSEFGLSQSRMWPAGTLCITIAANIAAAAILGFDACFPDSVVGFISGPRTNAAFVRVLVGFLRPILESFAPQMAQKNINLKILRDITVPIPPKQLQDKFAEEHDCVVSMAENARRAGDRLENLFTVLLHRAFSGDLTAKWREAHMKELLQEMEQQAKELQKGVKA